MILPRMVKGDDVWITVLILVVRLLTLLSSELIQAGGSSVERKRFSEIFFLQNFFPRVGWRGLCATVRGEGRWWEKKFTSSQQLLELCFGDCHQIKVNFLVLLANGKVNLNQTHFWGKKLTLQYTDAGAHCTLNQNDHEETEWWQNCWTSATCDLPNILDIFLRKIGIGWKWRRQTWSPRTPWRSPPPGSCAGPAHAWGTSAPDSRVMMLRKEKLFRKCCCKGTGQGLSSPMSSSQPSKPSYQIIGFSSLHPLTSEGYHRPFIIIIW